MSLRSESPIVYSKSLAKIDDTIARSQQAIGANKDYQRPNIDLPELLMDGEASDEVESSERSEDSLTHKPEIGERLLRPSETVLRLNQEKDALEAQIRDLGGKLKTEEYLKSSYERTVAELRDRIRELEDQNDRDDEQKREIRSVTQALKAEKTAKAVLSSREEALLQRIEDQDRRIRELERALRNQSVHTETSYLQQIEELKVTVDRLTRENQRLERQLQPASRDELRSSLISPESSVSETKRVDMLEKKLEAIDTKYRSQLEVNDELQRQLQYLHSHTPIDFTKSESATLMRFEEKMKKNSDKIEQLEEKVRRTAGLYAGLRAQVTRTPVSTDAGAFRDDRLPKPKSKVKKETRKVKSRPATAKASKH